MILRPVVLIFENHKLALPSQDAGVYFDVALRKNKKYPNNLPGVSLRSFATRTWPDFIQAPQSLRVKTNLQSTQRV